MSVEVYQFPLILIPVKQLKLKKPEIEISSCNTEGKLHFLLHAKHTHFITSAHC